MIQRKWDFNSGARFLGELKNKAKIKLVNPEISVCGGGHSEECSLRELPLYFYPSVDEMSVYHGVVLKQDKEYNT